MTRGVAKSDLQEAAARVATPPAPAAPAKGKGRKSVHQEAAPPGPTVAAAPAAAAAVASEVAPPQGGISAKLGGEFLDEVADIVGAKPGLAAELEWGSSVLRAVYGEDVPLSPAGEVVVKTAALVVGTAVHEAGGAEKVKERVRAWYEERKQRRAMKEDQARLQREALRGG